MVKFPENAYFGKRIAFAQLKKQGLAPRFGELIKSLVWAYKLSPETMQLAATDSVREIEVMDLAVKGKCSALRSLAAVISALDKIIPSPLIFRVFDEEGRALKIAFNLKASGGAAHGDSEVFRLFHTGETDLPLPQGLTTLESFYKHFAAAVGGMTTSAVESLRELEARHYRLESLNADLADIEKKISKEVQLDRKYALAKEKQKIVKEIKQCQNSKK